MVSYDSGKWVEVSSEAIARPKSLKKNTWVHYMLKYERDERRVDVNTLSRAKDIDWNKGSPDRSFSVVAYKVATPWYPDDSGKWVEVTGKGRPKGLKKSTVVEALLAGERKGKQFTSVTDKAGDLDWSRADQALLEHSVIVAYRIVKKD